MPAIFKIILDITASAIVKLVFKIVALFKIKQSA